MRLILTLTAACILALPVFGKGTTANSETTDPGAKPRAMMQLLKNWEGVWMQQSSYSEDRGATWVDAGQERVRFAYQQKGMTLVETSLDTTGPGFHMLTLFAYDQYRDHFRMAAIDDFWGLMDLYQGDIKDDMLIVTNVESGTTFPTEDGGQRHFRLTLALNGDTRTTHVDASDDGGKTWHPNFRIRLRRISD